MRGALRDVICWFDLLNCDTLWLWLVAHPSSSLPPCPHGLAVLQSAHKTVTPPHPSPVSCFSSFIRRLSRSEMEPIRHNFSCRQQRLISPWCKWGGRSPSGRWKIARWWPTSVCVRQDVQPVSLSAEMLPNFKQRAANQTNKKKKLQPCSSAKLCRGNKFLQL